MELTSRLSLEAIQREAIKILYANLNDKISEMETTWQSEDYDLLTGLDRESIEWTVEEISAENFYPGIVTSLINAPLDKYPNCSAICYTASPTFSSDDTADGYFCRLNIEIMVKSEKDEVEVNTRMHKTLDCAHLVLLENRDLNNLVSHITGPKVSIGDVFVRTEGRGQGPRWFWQGGVLEYDVYKYVNFV